MVCETTSNRNRIVRGKATWFLTVGQAVVLAVVFAMASASARAEDKTAARDHWERGTKFYDLGKYDDAIREFEAAYEAKSDPAFLYNLAQSHRLAGHNGDALRFYRTYLRYAPKAPNRADIEERIKELEKIAAEHPAPEPVPTAPPQPLPVETNPSPAGGAPPIGGPPVAGIVAPGSQATPWPPASGATNAAPSNAFPGGTPAASEATVPGMTPPPTTQPAPLGPRSVRKTTGTVLAISGGALFVVGAVFGLVARSQSKKVENAAANNARFDPSVESLGKTSQTLQWVGYGVGVAALATGLILVATTPVPAEQPGAARVAVVPVVSSDRAGALLRVTF
jgi:hypothetical protein